jgi:hypothetical protein
MALVLTLLITLAALASFALAMARHHRHVFGAPPSPGRRLVLRTLGWILLVAAPLPWMGSHGWLVALVAWLFCGVPVVGLAVVAFTAFTPERAGLDSSRPR